MNINKNIMECKNCKKPTSRTFCSTKCYNEHRKKEAAKRHAAMLDELQVENEDYVICKWCGMKVKRIYGTHIKNHHPSKTVNDYKKEFPGALITCNFDRQATSKNAGQHMKSDKYRKMASDAVKGEKNPNHKTKTTKKQRRERSPFSRDFYKKRGMNDKEIDIVLNKFVEKNTKKIFNSCNYKEYKMPSGKIVKVQGYEPQALDILLKEYDENDIVIGVKNIHNEIGKILYNYKNVIHKYYPDFYIKSTNTIVEVKSRWTYEKWKEKNIAKKNACEEQGFKFIMMFPCDEKIIS